MTEKDSLQKFIFEHADIRGEIVHLDETYRAIIQQREYPTIVQYLLGEALISCVLLMGSIKFEGEINLQFHGDKRLSLLLIQCDNNLNIRGFANFESDLQTEDYANAFLNGQMVITMKPAHTTEAFQSVVPILSTSMSENLMHYFAQSEQISSRVWLAASDGHAAGMLLQLLPNRATEEREQFWEYATAMGETVTEAELLNLDNKTILYRLYNEAEVRVFEPRPIQFKCRCTLEKIQQAVKLLGEAEAQDILKEKGVVEVTCDFCNHHYQFDAIDIAHLFKLIH